MDESTSFYAFVPSNSSMDVYHDNRPQNFKMQLPVPRHLEGKWEVGLCEITFQHSWYNIPNDTQVIVFFEQKGNITGVITTPGAEKLVSSKFNSDTSKVDEIHVVLPKGHYDGPAAIWSKMSDIIKTAIIKNDKDNGRGDIFPEHLFIFTYDKEQHKVKCKEHYKTVLFSDDAGGHFAALGFEPDKFQVVPDSSAASAWENVFKQLNYYSMPKTTKNLVNLVPNPVIFIYLDILEPQIVGDSLVKLLATVPVTKPFSQLVTRRFDRAFYMPVNSGYISTFNMSIANDKGKLLDFQGGEIFVQLHFRKVGL